MGVIRGDRDGGGEALLRDPVREGGASGCAGSGAHGCVCKCVSGGEASVGGGVRRQAPGGAGGRFGGMYCVMG